MPVEIVAPGSTVNAAGTGVSVPWTPSGPRFMLYLRVESVTGSPTIRPEIGFRAYEDFASAVNLSVWKAAAAESPTGGADYAYIFTDRESPETAQEEVQEIAKFHAPPHPIDARFVVGGTGSVTFGAQIIELY